MWYGAALGIYNYLMPSFFRFRLQSLHSFSSGYVLREESCFLVEGLWQREHRCDFVTELFLVRFCCMVSVLVASFASSCCERFLYCSGVVFFT